MRFIFHKQLQNPCNRAGTHRGEPTTTPTAAAKKRNTFDSKTFLSTIDGGRKIAAFSKKQAIFVQGDSSNAVLYTQKGKVKLTVVSKSGKEPTIGILNERDFFGEGCLTGSLSACAPQPQRPIAL